MLCTKIQPQSFFGSVAEHFTRVLPYGFRGKSFKYYIILTMYIAKGQRQITSGEEGWAVRGWGGGGGGGQTFDCDKKRFATLIIQ